MKHVFIFLDRLIGSFLTLLLGLSLYLTSWFFVGLSFFWDFKFHTKIADDFKEVPKDSIRALKLKFRITEIITEIANHSTRV